MPATILLGSLRPSLLICILPTKRNFRLQHLILRDFTIRQRVGSVSITTRPACRTLHIKTCAHATHHTSHATHRHATHHTHTQTHHTQVRHTPHATHHTSHTTRHTPHTTHHTSHTTHHTDTPHATHHTQTRHTPHTTHRYTTHRHATHHTPHTTRHTLHTQTHHTPHTDTPHTSAHSKRKSQCFYSALETQMFPCIRLVQCFIDIMLIDDSHCTVAGTLRRLKMQCSVSQQQCYSLADRL